MLVMYTLLHPFFFLLIKAEMKAFEKSVCLQSPLHLLQLGQERVVLFCLTP